MTTFWTPRAILFDLDGTLVDSAPGLGAAANKMRIDRGMPELPAELYRPMAGSGARGMLDIAFTVSPDAPGYADLRDEFFSNYEAGMLSNTTVFEGVPQVIKALLARGLRWGVVTNKSSRFTDPLTRSIALFSTASAIVSGDTTPFSKPHPEPLFEAARRTDVDPGDCVYVGDDVRDIVAGRAAGMRTIAATYGYIGVESDVGRWGADGGIESPIELLKLLNLA